MNEFVSVSDKDKVQSSNLGARQIIEPLGLLLFLVLFFGYVGSEMGLTNMFNTLFSTAHDLLLHTVLFLMGITVLAGALSRLLTEFHVIGLLERLLMPLMRPLFNLPGRAAMAAMMTFFSDNPAIISLAKDKRFSNSFKPHELISLTNFGTAFGMGLIVITFMATLESGSDQNFLQAALVGLAGAMVGAIISTRLMQRLTASDVKAIKLDELKSQKSELLEEHNNSPVWLRGLNSILDGGKSGVEMGMAIIPGVLIISTVVMVLTFGPSAEGYTGAAYEGVALLPKLAGELSWLFQLLFGFDHPELVAFPITSLGAVGAAMSLVPNFISQGIISESDIAVFTAMGMCWSGYLSTHTAMLDTLGFRNLTSKAIIAHTVGGLCAGVAARYIYLLTQSLF
ncbi:membrane protein [Endozoicomonas montiporae]|uniref:Membrane protein n=2 Tax=Endozoicomonas montiporae TaxID=1027273 RepID=A0A081N7V1_9GAMM|nr:nucleoside recognition domain-containing protein [Endozoicomonas montiporae]AMO55604.1 transporter gate domain-containing protein [Endozoicomonas montiporae CL-33]KEQ14524.1 membrane protein [Endozoicomonas montiporae]